MKSENKPHRTNEDHKGKKKLSFGAGHVTDYLQTVNWLTTNNSLQLT